MRLYAFSFFMQLLLLIPYLIRARHFGQSTKQAVHKALDLLVHAAPPAIPAVMLSCGFAVTIRLTKQDIRLMFPEVLKLAADTEVVCFDKTGTLTGSVVSTPTFIYFVACWVCKEGGGGKWQSQLYGSETPAGAAKQGCTADSHSMHCTC